MTSPIKSDSTIKYNNPFQNTIFNDQTYPSTMSSRDPTDPVYQNFTATGRPIPSSSLKPSSGLAGGRASADSYGASAPNLLPVRFTDNSIISVPVLSHAEPTQSKFDDYGDASSSIYSEDNPIKDQKSRSSRFSLSGFRRKSSSKGREQDFVMKEMTRGYYLKHYAKDDNGRYIGSEEPAVDCILNNEEDRVKWRRG